jgi:acetyl-CoA C-acetyltransferase
MQAVIFGAKTIALGDADLVVAGGMESMSNAPYYLEKARSGYRMGDGKIVDGMIFDGLWDPYSQVGSHGHVR